ncbi:MAG: ornithine--oxo-acid transaminase [Alphaproteobacteria bacterium]|nr:ornithine--oxo-acid transaminase [Alphaproteobacteria bacterium]
MNVKSYIARESVVCANTYTPLPIVLHKGKGSWLWDVEGKKYLDLMTAYSAVSFGHSHPRLVKALNDQAQLLALPSRAFFSDQLAPMMEKACALSGLDMGIPMNTGAEAVETAVKVARRWGYQVKGISENKAEIIVAENNFHGRTTTIISFSTERYYQKDFGPLTSGFKAVPFGDVQALEKAITPNTCAFLVEPIQGEAGIIVPPKGYLKEVRRICTEKNVLLILDEVQSGFGRTGKVFTFQHEGIQPDGLILGKALGGGLLPISLFLGRREMLSLMTPGSHGSTFGGNPLACAVAQEVMNLLVEERLADHSAKMGAYMLERFKEIQSPFIKEVRGMGLWAGIEFHENHLMARKVCEKLSERGVLSKDTHATIIRIAPPLNVTQEELDFGLDVFEGVLKEMEKEKS